MLGVGNRSSLTLVDTKMKDDDLAGASLVNLGLVPAYKCRRSLREVHRTRPWNLGTGLARLTTTWLP